VDSLATTLQALRGLGVQTTTPDAMAISGNLNYWTTAESCDGVQYQLIEKGAAPASKHSGRHRPYASVLESRITAARTEPMPGATAKASRQVARM
jgi:hypothetical protein